MEDTDDELENFRGLDRDGFVYRRCSDIDTFSVYQLLQRYMDEEEIDEQTQNKLLDFHFAPTPDGGLYLSGEKYNRKKHFLRLASFVARIYKDNHNKHAPRVKNKVKEREILKGKCGVGNIYPYWYISYIQQYMILHPISDWHLGIK